MRVSSCWRGIISVVSVSVLLGCEAAPVNEPSPVAMSHPAPLVAQEPPVVSRAGVLVFKDRQSLKATLDQLIHLDARGLRTWNRRLGFTSLREVFEDVVEQEALIDDRYERLLQSGPEGARLVPRQPVHSDAYLQAVRQGHLKVIREEAGEYFDYNLQQRHLAPVLDPDGRVAIGGVLMQYLPEGVKQVPYKSLDDLEGAKAALARTSVTAPSAPDTGLAVIPTKASCRSYSAVGNAWTYDGRRRFRAWVELKSYTQWNHTELYVSNFLTIQAMYRNWLGNWNYANYTADLNWGWIWSYYLNGYLQDSLPYPSSDWDSPWVYTLTVNNYAYTIAPHIDGYYSVPEPNIIEPVTLDVVDGTITIYGSKPNVLAMGTDFYCDVN
ncbi:hypothetical protein [Myxococcus sp. AB025B]|uniref:hypothetical protein n=1 Tax=Myxococcus sp. AB025B TaxID=2562794 RepID=UPI00129C3842|nr:hypothetical protein [Myxococcus sp. AB025B]